MKNIFAILGRDFLRLFKSPAALVVVLALLVLPSLYTWYNVLGFWDPYGNTGNMRVAVVNLDEGSSSDLTGQLNVGDTIIEELHDNTQLSWQFDDYDTAMADLESGKDYAVFIIPKDFTAKLLTLLTGEFDQPKLQYYVNMKTGPVGPKITDTGSTTLEETINSTFVSTVSDTVVNALTQAVGESEAALSEGSSKAAAEVGSAIAAVSNVRNSLADVDTALEKAQSKRAIALAALEDARSALSAVEGSLGTVSAKTSEVQKSLIAITPQATSAVNKALTALYALQGTAAAGGYSQELQTAISSLEACSNSFFSTMVPAVTDSLGNLSTTTQQLQAAAARQQSLIDQANVVLNEMDATLSTARNAVEQTDGLLATAESDLQDLQVSLNSLASSNALTQLVENGTLDAQAIADFMGSPTTVVTEKLYAVNAYGSAMAPLFMNLTFWIGAFMLLVIMRQEVDAKGIKNMKVSQGYVARFLMFAIFAALQGAICIAGVLYLGVEAANVPALFAAASLASVTYLSIIYALSVLFQHVGKGLCIILIFLQIPSATGLYPIEMMAKFYQAVSPFFPLTYGISAMREAVCGFYGNTYITDVAILLVYLFAFLIMGILLRPYLGNVNRTFAKEIAASGIYNGEDAEVPEHTFRLSQLARVISDRTEYRAQMIERYEKFQRYYPRLIRGAIIVGAAVPICVGIVFSLTVGAKVTLLSIWLAWMLLLMIFLTVVETLRSSFERQVSLGDMSSQDLRKIYTARKYVSEDADASEGEGHSQTAACDIPGDIYVDVQTCVSDVLNLRNGDQLVDCEQSQYKRLITEEEMAWLRGGDWYRG